MPTAGFRDGFKAIARMVAGPSAEQGLLIARDHYDRLGGYRPDARRSEARLLRQLGRSSRTHAAQPDHGGLTAQGRKPISKTTPCKVEREPIGVKIYLLKSNNYLTMASIEVSPCPSNDTDSQIAAVRAFSRFYTRKLGMLDQQLLDSPFSLSEARMLYEIAHRHDCRRQGDRQRTRARSRLPQPDVQSFDEDGLITRKPLTTDRGKPARADRQGAQASAKLERRSRDEVGAMLGQLSTTEGARLIGRRWRRSSSCWSRRPQRRRLPAAQPPPRRHRLGDLAPGHRLCRGIWLGHQLRGAGRRDLRAVHQNYDAAREHCWIAEAGGEPVGSVFLVKGSDEVAKLRLLLVEKKARGLGVGRALVEQCIRFAREKG